MSERGPEHPVSASDYAWLDYQLDEYQSRVNELEFENERLRRDALTGALVASEIRRELESAVDQAALTGRPCALIFGDVDNLKKINDKYGHAEGGDVVLRALGRSWRSSDVVGRIVGRSGGDEFWWVLKDLEPRSDLKGNQRFIKPTLEEKIGALAISYRKRAIDELKALPFGDEVGFSVGVAIYEAGDRAEDLISRADHDMYTNKSRNKLTQSELDDSINRHPAGFEPK